jgi:hypothetical protein
VTQECTYARIAQQQRVLLPNALVIAARALTHVLHGTKSLAAQVRGCRTKVPGPEVEESSRADHNRKIDDIM